MPGLSPQEDQPFDSLRVKVRILLSYDRPVAPTDYRVPLTVFTKKVFPNSFNIRNDVRSLKKSVILIPRGNLAKSGTTLMKDNDIVPVVTKKISKCHIIGTRNDLPWAASTEQYVLFFFGARRR